LDDKTEQGFLRSVFLYWLLCLCADLPESALEYRYYTTVAPLLRYRRYRRF